MPTDSDYGKKSHRSDEHRRQKRDTPQRYDDSGNGVYDHAHYRRHEREETKKSKKRERDNERRGYRRRRKNSGDASESGNDEKYGGNRNDHESRGRRNQSRDRREKRREKPSSKKRKKSSRTKYLDDDSYCNSDHDKISNNRRKKKQSSKSRQGISDKKSTKALSTKKPDKSKLFPMGDPFGRPPNSEVDAERDYFSFHLEFSIYLFREEGTCFNDINTREARAAFVRFAKQYNAGMLEEPYYNRGFPTKVLEESKTTNHSWSFKTTHSERKGLGDLQKGVRRQTEYNSNRDTKAKLDVKNPNSIRSSEVACSMVESLSSNLRRHTTHEERSNQRFVER